MKHYQNHSTSLMKLLLFTCLSVLLFACQKNESMIVDSNIPKPDKREVTAREEVIKLASAYLNYGFTVSNDGRFLYYVKETSSYDGTYTLKQYNFDTKEEQVMSTAKGWYQGLSVDNTTGDLFYLNYDKEQYYYWYLSYYKFNPSTRSETKFLDTVRSFAISSGGTGSVVCRYEIEYGYLYNYAIYYLNNKTKKLDFIYKDSDTLRFGFGTTEDQVYFILSNGLAYKYDVTSFKLTKISQNEAIKYIYKTETFLSSASVSVTNSNSSVMKVNINVLNSAHKSIFLYSKDYADKVYTYNYDVKFFDNEKKIIVLVNINPEYSSYNKSKLYFIDLIKQKIAEMDFQLTNDKISYKFLNNSTKIFIGMRSTFRIFDWEKTFN